MVILSASNHLSFTCLTESSFPSSKALANIMLRRPLSYLSGNLAPWKIKWTVTRFSLVLIRTKPPTLVAEAAVLSKTVVLLLLIFCLMYFPLFVGVLCLSLYCYALLCFHYSLAIISKRKRKLVALILLSYRCNFTVNVLWLFYTRCRG